VYGVATLFDTERNKMLNLSGICSQIKNKFSLNSFINHFEHKIEELNKETVDEDVIN
jgi:hypothetical protein